MKRRALSFIITLALCLNLCPVWVLALDEGISGGLCLHHPEHTDECGYVSEEPGAPCTFACRVCPIEDLISDLPASVSADNGEQVQTQLDEIYALCDGLTMDELQQVDLSPCVSLLEQMAGLEAEVQSDASGDSPVPDGIWVLDGPQSFDTTHKISTVYVIDTKGYPLTGPNSTVIEVTETGWLDLKGTVVSNAGAGLEVSGTLRITEQANIRGQTYALYIASGASVYLSTGTYFGKMAAIYTEDDNFADLLVPGCAFFDESGSPILPEKMARVREVTVKQCTDHSKTYIHSKDSPTHAWTCAYCGTTEQEEKCTFNFDGNVSANCRELCGNSINITVDESQLSDLIYNGADQTANVTLTVELNHDTTLVKDKDYTVDYSARTDVGEITVTVTGVTFNGTFVKTYAIQPDRPGITWDASVWGVDYDSEGRPVDSSKLPHITIQIIASSDEDLRSQLKYSYRESGSTGAFTDGLPANAGTYEVKAYLTASQNYEAAETSPCLTLTIKKIDALLKAPASALPVYDGDAHALVTAGKVQNNVVIEYAREKSGPYTADIPTGINAGDYTVWYRVTADTNNYNVVPETEVLGVKILRKKITPTVTPAESSYVYDGSKHEPQITVKEGITEIGKDQYDITWSGASGQAAADLLRAAGVYTANIEGKATGNYEFTATATVEIIAADQNALTITGKPSHVYYGDTITTLDTTGGTANGTVKWSITKGNTSATIDPDTGKLTIRDIGSVTVTAERTVLNYGTVSADWTFDVEPKPVVAEVTIQPKVYDGSDSISSNDIHAIVKSSDRVNPADTVTISGLKGTYDNANAGTNKTVTLDSTQAAADNIGKYAVSYPAAVKGNIEPKPIAVTVELSDHDLKQADDGTYYYDYDGSVRTPAVTVIEKDNHAVLAVSDYTVDYSNNKNVSTANATAVVTVTAKVGGNYTFGEEKVNFIIKSTGAVLTSTPEAKDLTYNGELQDLVTVGAATGGTVVYSDTGAPGSYSETVPQGREARPYTVYYMVKGDANHADTAPGLVHVTIKPKTVISPVIKVAGSYTYDGGAKEPAAGTDVTIEDDGTTIQPDEYTLSYRDNVNAGTATVIVSDNNGGNYTINGTAAFEIAKAAPDVPTPPEGRENLPYNGTAQALVTAGSASGGTLVYSLNQSGEYSPVIPTGKDVGAYTVWYKVQGDSNHNDSGELQVSASIIPNTVTDPTIQVIPESVTFNGKRQEPAVTVRDDRGLLIDSGEYDIAYSGDMTAEGTYTVTITGGAKGNYTFDATNSKNTASFTILPADQTPLTITGTRERVYYGETIQLGTMGGSGAVTWDVGGSTIASINNGLLTITGVGPVTVTATSKAAGYTDQTATWPFFAEKKPVTAVVTAESKTYDNDKRTTVTAVLQSSDLVVDDVVKITLEGSFGDPNAGTDKTVYVDSTNPQFSDDSKGQENYAITYPATTTASITPATAKVKDMPVKAENLTYTGGLQNLLSNGGTAEGGNLAYSLNGFDYNSNIPTGTDACDYTVWYKAVAVDKNYTDSEPVKMGPVTIAARNCTPAVLCRPDKVQYDGTEKTPNVIVTDDRGQVIPNVEYTEEFEPGRIAVGPYRVTVTDKQGGNYEFNTPVTATFNIVEASQNSLSIITDKSTVYYGETFHLSAMGGSGNGDIEWSTSAPTVADIDGNGVVTVKGTGTFTITAYRTADDSYSESNRDTVSFYANPKPVTPMVTAENKLYDGTTTAKLKATWKNGDMVNGDSINLDTVSIGTFDSAAVGTNKRVTFVVPNNLMGKVENYYITWPDSTTASIDKADVVLAPPPVGNTGLKYMGSPQELVTAGETKDGIGTIVYSLEQNGEYSTAVPTATGAGTYFVWYEVAHSANYTGISAKFIKVEIGKADPIVELFPVVSNGTVGQSLKDIAFSGGKASVDGKFAWKNDSVKPGEGTSQQDMIFTPDDTANYNPVEFKVTVTINPASGSDSTSGGTETGGTPSAGSASSADTVSAPMQTTIQNGTASTVVSAAEGSKLVKEAAANQSQNIVIKPEITGDVTKVQVSIPASTVSQIKNETNAALTVSASIADVTIPNAALDTLARAGGTVDIVTEQVDQGVALTLTAGGEKVESVPGGLTLTVPVENAAPGTVAVLVHDDGTRETIRKSVAKGGVVNIPLSGSATVEIVDNSKEFTDVPSTSWAADAVAFASAHELFNGTSTTTFGPDQAMSRGMLTTVLYNLEGRPEQDLTMRDLTDGYSDVSSDAWYADGVAWASEKGIVSGYGNGQFSPDDSVTREQFAVILWRYAGSPKANNQALSFTDADQASSFAQEALCWAVEKGILNGYANEQLAPGGTATRAEAAQMLKNFMQNS